MKTIDTWKELTTKTFSEMGTTFAEILPNILGALIILLVGWLVTKLVLYIIKRLLRFLKIEKWNEAINEKVMPSKTHFKIDIERVILTFVKWFLYLVFFIIAADVIHWEIVSREVGNLVRYLPQLFSAVALFMIGIYIANFVKKAVKGLFDSFDLRGSRLISTLVFYIIAFIITVTALNQAGVDTEIITNNTTMILGAFLLAVALSFGFGAKDIVKDILRTAYARKKFKVGQKISYKEINGTIVSIENMTLDIETENGVLVVPIHKAIEEEILVSKK